MAQTDIRPSFRLPWNAERAEAGPGADEAQPPDQDMETPEMIDATAQSAAALTSTPPAGLATVAGGARTSESATASRRPSKLMADLSRAMQAAAEHARDETLSRLEADAKTVVEEINAASNVDAANLRRQADDDVAAVREWSKAEIARIRELTEERIAQRKTALDGEMEAHASAVQARIERVGARVTGYRTEMDSFFGRLLAEEDPTRIATMAEMMPEPPSLAEVAASILEPEPTPFPAMPPSFAVAAAPAGVEGPSPVAVVAPVEAAPSGPQAVDFAAAEAEAAELSADLDAPDDEATDPQTPAAADTPVVAHPSGGRTITRVVVLGLVSVASIATFKRELARTPGVTAIGVASGPDGEFIFTVTHDSGLDLAGVVTALGEFEARITAQATGSLEVAARDPDAAD